MNLSEFIKSVDMKFVNMANQSFKEQSSGPSLYFHQKCIKLALSKNSKEFLSKEHVESIYAVLPAWGMHRMGRDVMAKVPDFKIFSRSILKHRGLFLRLRDKKITDNNLECVLKKDILKIFKELQGSISEAKLVANSKVLTHILPRLVAPIDRAYTLKFFSQFGFSKSIPSMLDRQGEQFVDLTLEMASIAKHVKKIGYKHPDLPKVTDNLIIYYVVSKGL